MLVKGEGLIRLDAERRLVSLYSIEYQRLAQGVGHVEAMRQLVTSHAGRYDELTRQARQDLARRPPAAESDGRTTAGSTAA
jgi:hypothetical protein